MQNTIAPDVSAAIYAAMTPAAVPAGTTRRKPMTVRRAYLQDIAQHAAIDPLGPKREYKLPWLPQGVVPTSLDADIPVTGEVRRGGLAMDSAAGGSFMPWIGGEGLGCGLYFPGYPFLAELTQISEYRAPAETTSTEMCREWLKLVSKDGGKDKADKIAELMSALDEFKVKELFQRAALLDGEFGRAQIYIDDGSDELARQQPLEPEQLKKGGLKSLVCIEPYWTTPYSWNAQYPERKDFYKPVSWYIMGRKTHASRLCTFIGREMPDLLKPAYNFGGISLTQLMMPYVNAWLRTRKSVNDLVNNFSIPVLETDLEATLEDGGVAGNGLVARLQAFTITRNNQSVAAIQKDDETLSFAEASLAGLDKLQAQAQEHMASPGHIPLIKLFGITPSGLNATGEGEIKVWYDWIASFQVHLFDVHMIRILRFLQMHLFGSIDEDIVHQWVPLDAPTQKELAEMKKNDADAGAQYINAGVIDPAEERERLKNDPESGYSNLTGGPPEPEEPPEPDVDPEGEANREHEANEADKQRQHEVELAAAKRSEPAVPIRPKTKD